MKNKLKVVICVVMTCVFLLIPFSAFAYPDNPSPKLLYDIAQGTGKSIYSGYQVMCEDSNNYYLWTVEFSNINCSVSTNSYPCNINMGGGGASVQILPLFLLILSLIFMMFQSMKISRVIITIIN